MAAERSTKQKQIVGKIMHAAERPLTINEVHARGQKELAGLGLATVYRELNRLSEAGEVQAVVIPGDPPRYEMAKHHHHHFKCTACGKVYETHGCFEEIAKLVPKGFKPKTHELTFYGLCRACG